MLIALITRGLTVTLLIIALVGKSSSRASFDEFARSIRLLPAPRRRRRIAAGAVLAAEGLSIAALVLPLPSAWQFAPACVLFAGFAIYLLVMHRRVHDFDCHCFGSRTKSWPPAVNISINACVSVACGFAISKGSVADHPVGDVVFYTGAGVIVGLLIVTLPGTTPRPAR